MRLSAALIILSLPIIGCSSKPRKKAVPPWGALPPAQRLPQTPMNQQLGVTVQGLVRNSLVPWTPDLTLARALVEADYVGPRDPQSIVIFRGDKAILVETRQLLSGVKDPPLFPGDVIELRR